MTLGVLFSGQGGQHPQMLPWLDERGEGLQRTCAALGRHDWRAALADPAWAQGNRQAQVLLTGLALSAWQQVAGQLPVPGAVAGYSVGELAAFSAAGVFDATTALELASHRALAMDRCAGAAPGGLLSVGQLSRAIVADWCQQAGAALAIDIAEDSQVVGGTMAALQRVEAQALAAGGKVSRLPVEVASHTPLMQGAAAAFAAHLAQVPLRDPAVPLFSNATGRRVHGRDEAANVLAGQIAQPVRWDGLLEALHEQRVRCVLEIGPGHALATHWTRRFPHVPARSADEFRSLGALVAWVERSLSS